MLARSLTRIIPLQFRPNFLVNKVIAVKLDDSRNIFPTLAQLHTGGQIGAKKFSETENDYAHEILQRSVAAGHSFTQQRVFKIKSQQEFSEIIHWDELTAREVLDQFHQVVAVCKRDEIGISDGRFDGFVEALVRKAPELEDDELVEVLNLLVELGPTPAVDTRNYRDIWNAADKVCLSRVPVWSTEKLLFMADQWYPLRLSKIGKFVTKAIWKVSNKLRKLKKDQLVRTVFYINLTRAPVENMIDIEFNLKRNFFDFEIDDLAILCMGFFKTETPVRSADLVDRIYQYTIHHAADVKDISLAAILKLLRYSSRIPHAPSMERLLTAFIPEIPRISLFCCLHLALLGSDIHLCHQASLEAIIERFTKDIKLLRLKDMERIAFVIAHYNMTMADNKDVKLLEAILQELPSRIQEITTYPKSYLSVLNFLALKEIYSAEQITAAFEKRFLFLTYGRNIPGAGREVIALDGFLRINLRDRNYTGNYFPEKAFKIVSKLTQDYVPSLEHRLTKSDRMLLEIQNAFQNRHKFAHIIHLLPHYQRPDVLLLWDDETKQFLDVASYCPPHYSGNILDREFLLKDETGRQNLRLIAIVAGSWNCYVRDYNRITGGFAMKLKQLGMLGMETVVVPWHEWPLQSQEAQESYLFEKINLLLEQR